LRHAIEIIRDSVWSDCVVVDGWGRSQEIAQRICGIFDKRFVCITHGWLPYENEVNGLGLSEDQMRRYTNFMGRCDGIAAVSRLQAQFNAEQLPEMAGRISWFFNGVERRAPLQHRRLNRLVVSVSGGTRPIKRNIVVANACDLLREKGIDLELRVYGRDYAGDTSWLSRPGVRYMGQVAQDEFLSGLAETDVFVMASLHEPFGLSAIDALQAGASLLLSDTCGVADVLALQGGDVIPHDASPEVIAERVMTLHRHSNAERLVESIDYDRYSWDAAAKGLRAICAGEDGYPFMSDRDKD
jgi:glycosyltransferase involved in cell wall biosynthesis